MNTSVIIGGIQIIGFAILAFVPFDRRRVRARWANFTLGICSVIGIARGIADLARNFDWLASGSYASRLFESYYDLAGGLLLGFLFSLLVSSQLIGQKREAKHPPGIALQPTPPAH